MSEYVVLTHWSVHLFTSDRYLGRAPDHGNEDGSGITGALMAQYLMAMLGHRGPFPDMPGGDPATRGRMGDYVFNQEGAPISVIRRIEC